MRVDLIVRTGLQASVEGRRVGQHDIGGMLLQPKKRTLQDVKTCQKTQGVSLNRSFKQSVAVNLQMAPFEMR